MNKNTFQDQCNFSFESRMIQPLQRTIKNEENQPLILEDCLYLKLCLPTEFCHLSYLSSSWGQELIIKETTISNTFSFQNTKGRCSGESAPFFTLSSNQLHIDFALATSGNYKVTVSNEEEGMLLCITDIDPLFSTLIPVGETFSFPIVYAHVYQSLEECYKTKQEWRKTTLKEHPVYTNLPIIYNHWWAYEHCHINEDVVLANAQIAKSLGLEIVVLDAGWFGNDNSSEDWFQVRGDWDLINQIRFPHGLSWLCEQIEALGMKFGIWCELEGLGAHATLAKKHPDFVATRNGDSLGYVCFGHKEVQEWAYEVMCNLFSQCSASYWKLDFNLDPGVGCNAVGHSHGEHDGLYAHYQGLYHVLDRLRSTFPNLTIENCSSGGQRLNLEIAEHLHIHFLSDPDYSTHQMRLFKEASKWLLPKEILHFMWSNTVTTNGSAPFANLDLDQCSKGEIRYHMRLAMMHQFGISHRLIEYTSQTLSIIKTELELYKTHIRPFIANGNYLPLYLSEDVNIFSFTYNKQVLLFFFAQKPCKLTYSLNAILADDKTYMVTDMDTLEIETKVENAIMDYHFQANCNWTCSLLHIQ